MSKAAYRYPPDEFDATPDPDAPRGVHRAPRSAWSRWWPFLLVLIVVPLIAWAAVTYLADEGRLPGNDAEEPLPTSATTAPTPTSTQTAAEPTPTVTAEPTPTEAAPNLATPVSVLNGAGIGGLAGRQADELRTAGFTDVTPGNATSDTPVASTVFYGSEDLRSTAELVASTLGLDTLVLSPIDAPQGITVILREDPDA